jgi:hypothetical protein
MELNDNSDGRTRWEYHTLTPMMLNSSSLDSVLTEFGWLGWEIASTNIFSHLMTTTHIFMLY